MSSTMPPPLPSPAHYGPPRRPGWWQRHWKWAVPLLFLAMLAFAGGFVYLLLSMIGKGMRDNDAYRIALERARADQHVIAALGKPIQQKGFPSGRIVADTFAELRIPISGSRAKGAIYIEAHTHTGVWKFATLAVTPDGSDTPIDLLPSLPPQRRTTPDEAEKARARNADDNF